MNCVLRVTLPTRSLIIKQARPWVEKYPSIAAPIERAASESFFYRRAARHPELAAMMPRLLDFDEASSVLILEDLGSASQVADCYHGVSLLSRHELEKLAHFISTLHRLKISPSEHSAFRNLEMRQLNHEHIFDLPLRNDGALAVMLDGITPGLYAAGESLRHDRITCEKVQMLGQRYLDQEGAALIHGDFFLGSLLRTNDGALRVIDPEFCFCGDPEFDIGVFFAHLVLSGHDEETTEFWLQEALKDKQHSQSLALQYAGVEIMRRILGVAQLPVTLSLEEKKTLLERSSFLIHRGLR
jgi:5-methylthioribose kinase